MLNTKYVITKNQQGEVVQQNPGNLGACWFAKQVAFVKDDAAAMRALDNNNPADSAIIEEAEKNKIAFIPVPDSTAKIQLIKNDNDIITYTSKAIQISLQYLVKFIMTVDGKHILIIKKYQL